MTPFNVGDVAHTRPVPITGLASDEELVGLIRDGVWAKWSGHRITHADFVQPERSMSMIGG